VPQHAIDFPPVVTKSRALVADMGIASLIFSFNAPKVLSIRDVRLGLIHRTWQIIVIVAICLISLGEEPWRKKGLGRHFFVVRPKLPSDEQLSSLASRILSVQDDSFFVALNYTSHQEDRCESGTGWCAVAGTSETALTVEASRGMGLSVSTRFEPNEDVFEWCATQVKFFTHDGGFDMSMNDLFSQLAEQQGMAVDEWIAATALKGAEAQLTFDWRCEDSSGLTQGDCDVKVELGQLSSSHGFQASGVTLLQPVSAASGSLGAVRRRSHVTGLTVHMRGEGGIEATMITSVLGVVASAVILLIIGNQILTFLTTSIMSGAYRRSLRCHEHYFDDVHQQIAEIVKQKKDAQPELAGLSDATVHAKLVDDIETLCGFELHGKARKDKVKKVLTALEKTSGSTQMAALELKAEGGATFRLGTFKGATKPKGAAERSIDLERRAFEPKGAEPKEVVV